MADCDCPDVVEWGPLHSCWLLRTARNSTVSSRVACVQLHTRTLSVISHHLHFDIGCPRGGESLAQSCFVILRPDFFHLREKQLRSLWEDKMLWHHILSVKVSHRMKCWSVARIIRTRKSIRSEAAWELGDIHAPHDAELWRAFLLGVRLTDGSLGCPEAMFCISSHVMIFLLLYVKFGHFPVGFQLLCGSLGVNFIQVCRWHIA